MNDGSVTLSTGLDNAQLEKDLKRVETKVRNAGDRISKAQRDKSPFLVDVQKLEGELKAAESKLQKHQNRFAELQDITLDPSIGRQDERYKKAAAEIPQARDTISNQQVVVEDLKR